MISPWSAARDTFTRCGFLLRTCSRFESRRSSRFQREHLGPGPLHVGHRPHPYHRSARGWTAPQLHRLWRCEVYNGDELCNSRHRRQLRMIGEVIHDVDAVPLAVPGLAPSMRRCARRWTSRVSRTCGRRSSSTTCRGHCGLVGARPCRFSFLRARRSANRHAPLRPSKSSAPNLLSIPVMRPFGVGPWNSRISSTESSVISFAPRSSARCSRVIPPA
jgi:hypothetical protein